MSVPVFRSPVLPAPFAHAFSTRIGGVSEGPYATLNLSAGWGDDAARVAENRRRFLHAAGLADVALATVRQVHGREVAGAAAALRGRIEADAVVVESGGERVAVGVLTADCVPILLADPATGCVAAAHAGWRGTVADVAGAVIAEVARRGARTDALRAALGPSICVACFEVGEEVAAAFTERGLAAAVVRRREWARPHVDLHAANALLLRHAGLLAEHIDAAPPCTRCQPDRFFSYRRDGRAGQHLAVIAPP